MLDAGYESLHTVSHSFPDDALFHLNGVTS
jgi:hypothetical protein